MNTSEKAALHNVRESKRASFFMRNRLLLIVLAIVLVILSVTFTIQGRASASWTDADGVWIKCVVVFILILFPLLLWGILKRRYVEPETAPFHIHTDADFIVACDQIIHYFDLQGKNIATTPINLTIKPDPEFTVLALTPNNIRQTVHSLTPTQDVDAKHIDALSQVDNIATTLASIRKHLVGDTVTEPREKARLTLIYDYLSSALSNYDNDITVETIADATDINKARSANFNYAFGAISILVITVICHSYMNNLDNDSAEGSRTLAIFSSLLREQSALDTSVSSNKSAATSSRFSASAFAPKEDSTRPWRTYSRPALDTAKKLQDISDSLAIIHSALLTRIRWIHNDMKIYPLSFRVADEDNKPFIDTAYHALGGLTVQSLASSWLYLSHQSADDLRKYILPMLYGLVGSFLWVIRMLSEQAKSFDLTWKKLVRHRARILFGLFVGMFFGYLFAVPTGASTTITPFVIAFIAGYNVEVLFTFMDKVIATFTSSSSNKTDTTTSSG